MQAEVIVWQALMASLRNMGLILGQREFFEKSMTMLQKGRCDNQMNRVSLKINWR